MQTETQYSEANDRRAFRRAQIRIPVQMSVPGLAHYIGGITRDASHEAAFVETTALYPVSTAIELSFAMTGDEPFAPDLGLNLSGSVLRVTSGDGGRARGMVILFHGEETLP